MKSSMSLNLLLEGTIFPKFGLKNKVISNSFTGMVAELIHAPQSKSRVHDPSPSSNTNSFFHLIISKSFICYSKLLYNSKPSFSFHSITTLPMNTMFNTRIISFSQTYSPLDLFTISSTRSNFNPLRHFLHMLKSI